MLSGKERCCKVCGMAKPVESFGRYKSRGVEYRRHTCKGCYNKKWSPIIASHNSRYYHENVNGYADRKRQQASRQHLENPQAHYNRNVEYWRRHPQKAACTQAVRAAVKSGKLKRLPCSICGSQRSQAHHDDYTKPLEVVWFCSKHHGERHRDINRSTDGGGSNGS